MSDKVEVIKTGLNNAYGEVEFYKSKGRYYMTLDDYVGGDEVEISEGFYILAKLEFGEGE